MRSRDDHREVALCQALSEAVIVVPGDTSLPEGSSEGTGVYQYAPTRCSSGVGWAYGSCTSRDYFSACWCDYRERRVYRRAEKRHPCTRIAATAHWFWLHARGIRRRLPSCSPVTARC